MKTSRRFEAAAVTLLALALTVGLGSVVHAQDAEVQPYAVGDELPALTLEDQHGQAHTLGATTRIVVFGRDMDAGKVIKATLAEEGASLLEAAGAVYVADISAMPGLISRLFAIPAMRKRAYTMWLDRDGESTARFPAAPGQATVIHLDGRRITRIDQTSSAEDLRQMLAGTPASE